MACGLKNGECLILNAENLERVHCIKAHRSGIQAVEFSPDGRRLATGADDAMINVWDTRSGLELVRLPGHEDYVHALAMSPTGRIVASASGDNTVRIWDARPLREKFEERKRMLAAEHAVRDRVKRLLREVGSIDKVLQAIEADSALGPLEKVAAWNVVHLSRKSP